MDNLWIIYGYGFSVPSGNDCYSLLLFLMAIQIVGFPLKHGGSVHSCVIKRLPEGNSSD